MRELLERYFGAKQSLEVISDPLGVSDSTTEDDLEDWSRTLTRRWNSIPVTPTPLENSGSPFLHLRLHAFAPWVSWIVPPLFGLVALLFVAIAELPIAVVGVVVVLTFIRTLNATSAIDWMVGNGQIEARNATGSKRSLAICTIEDIQVMYLNSEGIDIWTGLKTRVRLPTFTVRSYRTLLFATRMLQQYCAHYRSEPISPVSNTIARETNKGAL